MLKLRWDNTVGAARLQKTAEGALDEDDGLETMVLIALFTDAEATPEELAAAGLVEQRGWWAEAAQLREPDRPRLGSKLWLLAREKTRVQTLKRAELYCLEALAWLKTVGIAASIEVFASVPRSGWLGLEITITKPGQLNSKWKKLWEVQANVVVQ